LLNRTVYRPNSSTGAPRPPRDLVLKSAQANPAAFPREFHVSPCQFARGAGDVQSPGSCERRELHRSVLKRKSVARAGRFSPRQIPRRPLAKDKEHHRASRNVGASSRSTAGVLANKKQKAVMPPGA